MDQTNVRMECLRLARSCEIREITADSEVILKRAREFYNFVMDIGPSPAGTQEPLKVAA